MADRETEVRAEERHRIVWWLRRAVNGPASVNTDPLDARRSAPTQGA